MDRSGAAEALRQVMEGVDIPKPESLLNMSIEKASLKLAWMPYSILTNLVHADFWQQIWLDRLDGKRARSFTEDWKTPAPEEWPAVRARFMEGLRKAHAVATTTPFQHKLKYDEVAVKTLYQIAIHDAYHLGQINLLKRGLRLSGKEEGPQET
jgi:hypothetical protein